jgi:hypothetical protein
VRLARALLACAALTLSALLAAYASPAQDKPAPAKPAPEKPPQEKPAAPQAPVVHCGFCTNVGLTECPKHTKAEMPFERNVLYCTTIADCAVCGGTGWLDCTHCENPEADAWLAHKQSQIASFKSEAQKLDEKMGKPMRMVFTEHFVLVWEIEQLKVEKRMLQHHELMHVYAQRLETLFTDFTEALQASPREFAKRTQVFVWWMPNDHLECSLKFCESSGGRGVKLLGATSVYSVCGNKQNFTGDEPLHRNIVHSVAHLLLAHENPSFWIGNIKGGWADEGLAHWFENKYFNVCDNYCYEEQNTNVDFKGGTWKPVIRKMVAMGDVPPVSTVLDINTDQLTLPMHAVSFSYVDYLLQLDGKKFNALVKQLKVKVPTRDAMKKVYGFTPFEFEEKWKAWVLETYPVR